MDFALLWRYLLHHFLLDSRTERIRKEVLGEICLRYISHKKSHCFHHKNNVLCICKTLKPFHTSFHLRHSTRWSREGTFSIYNFPWKKFMAIIYINHKLIKKTFTWIEYFIQMYEPTLPESSTWIHNKYFMS